MKQPRFNPFRRLQWRLTLSYTLVTVGALLFVELILLGALLLLLNSDFLVTRLVTTIRDDITPQLSAYLEESPPDLAGLNDWLEPAASRQAGQGQASPRLTRGLSINLEPDEGDIYILDAQGYLLAQLVSPGHEARLGHAFDIPAYPELGRLLPLALAGEKELARLQAVSPAGMLLIALPITGQANTVLGALAMALPLPLLNSQSLGAILSLVLYSAIPLTLIAAAIGTIFGFLTARGLTRRLRRLARSADAWGRADFTVVNRDDSADEMGQLSRQLNQMAEQLQHLLQTQQELAALQERNRLARDLHDSVKQQVFATTMQISAAKALLPADTAAAAQHLHEAEQLSHQSQQELATLIEALRPAALAGQGLAAALREYATDWSRRSQIPVEIEVTGSQPIPPAVEQALYRVAQEALANVARHSQASSARIRLARETSQISLTIRDDGRGFQIANEAPRGFGTQTMRQRMAEVEGWLTLESTPGAGTRVIARVDLAS